jgi:uracil-DNA glycosylase family protein
MLSTLLAHQSGMEVSMPRRVTPLAMTAAPLIPEHPTLAQLRITAAGCQACDLWKSGTQTVFGAGDSRAEIMLIGEQPGDREDIVGQPFVGPAGQLLDQALMEVGIDRQRTYVTNVVKHFKWIPKGRLRLHQTPTAQEIAACRPWLDSEITLLKPRAIICLGATAAQALHGKHFRVTRQRGEFVESPLAPLVMATLHPAAILRIPDATARNTAHHQFIADLQKVARQLISSEKEPVVRKTSQGL